MALLILGVAHAAQVPAPVMHAEPQFTRAEWVAAQQNTRWNWVEWDPSSGPGTIVYKVQCLIGDPPYTDPHMFAEPWATRGDYNTVFVAAPILSEVPFGWQLTDTQWSFWYTPGWESYLPFLLHDATLAYRAKAAVSGDTLNTASDWSYPVTSTQDNAPPGVTGLNMPDITGATSGDVVGTVEVKDSPAGVHHAYLRYRRGQESWQETPWLDWVGGDWYEFTVPEPGGGWGSIAGDYVSFELIAFDNAALPDEQWPSDESGNELISPWQEYVEGAVLLSLPAAPRPTAPGPGRRFWGRRSAAAAREDDAPPPRVRETFIIQVSDDPSFGSVVDEQQVSSALGYASCQFTGLFHGARYYYRVRTPASGWSNLTQSWQDWYPPDIIAASYQTDPADLNAASTGDLHGWIEIEDYPALVQRAYGYFQRGSVDPSPQEFEMVNEGGDTWGFYVPEPPGGWEAIAGEALTVEIRAYDGASAHDGWGADGWESSWTAPPDTINAVKPSVTLISPDGGEQWSGTETILWDATDPDGPDENLDMNLWFKRQGELFWTPIAAGLPNTGQFDWNTGQVPYDASDYRVRIRATDPDQFWDEDTSGAFTIDNHAPNVELFVPNGGEWWFGVREITWYAADSMGASGESIYVDVGFKQDFEPFWNLLIQDLLVPSEGDTGAHLWNTDDVPEGDQYRVKVQARDRVGHIAADSSDATFIINREDPPEVEVLFPNGGEILDGTITVRWSASDPDTAYGDSLLVDVEFSPDGGTQWIGLQYGAPNTDSLVWNTTGLDDGNNYLIRVRGVDIHGLSTADMSDAPFTLFNHDSPPRVELLYPNGGEQLEGVVQVLWDAADPDTLLGDSLLVDLEASPDSGQTWVELVSGTEDDDVWSWNTTEMEDSPTYLLRITVRDIKDSTATDVSDSLFSIFNLNHAPVVDLLEPVGGEYWWGVRDIRWHAYDPDSLLGDTLVVSLWYSPDAGWQWLPLQDSIPNSGAWTWDTETVPDDSLYMVKVQAWDISGEMAVDYSDTTFIINQNEGPTLELLAPLGGEIWKGDEEVRWEADDPDLPFGDTLSIDLYVSDDAGDNWMPLALRLADTGGWTWDTRTVPDGLLYMVRAATRDTAGLWDQDSSGIFSIENYNLPPAAFHLVAPESAASMAVLVPQFSWTPAPDIDAGDRVHYTVVCDTTPEHVSSQFWDAGPDTFLVPPEPLRDNTIYYWRVLAIDSLGPDTTVSAETGWWFVTNLGGLNDPPQEFSLVAPAPDSLLMTLTPRFTWTSSWDPDPLDWVEYRLYTDTLSTFSTARVEEAGTDTSLVVTEPLVDNRKYYWKVQAFDPHGAVTWANEGTWWFYTDTANDLPAAFSLVRPESESVETQLFPLLQWTASSDPDPVDSLWYSVWLDTLDDFSTSRGFLSADTSTTPPDSLWPDGLDDNAKWYWKVAAHDTRLDSTWSVETDWWFYTNSTNDAPFEFNLLEPESAVVITGATPTFRWEEAADLDPLDDVTYTLWYDKHADFHTYREVTDISSTQYTLTSPMRERGTVYWKVKATDLAGASVWSRQKDWWFVVPPQEMVEGFINYPNPFDPESGVTTLQYVLMQHADITIRVFDLLGGSVGTLRYQAGAEGGMAGTNRVAWDGRDGRGNLVGNGGYLCLLEARFADGSTVEKRRKVAVLR
jgi:hypothetical protein